MIEQELFDEAEGIVTDVLSLCEGHIAEDAVTGLVSALVYLVHNIAEDGHGPALLDHIIETMRETYALSTRERMD